MDCLENVIGLISEDCNCRNPPSTFPTDNESSSGLYVASNDSIPLNMVEDAVFCGTGGVYELLKDSRASAVKDFVRDFKREISMRYEFAVNSFDTIGGVKAPARAFVNKDYVGYGTRTYPIRGGIFVLHGVELNFRVLPAGTVVTVEVYDGDDLSAPLTTETVTLTGARQWHEVTFSSPVVVETQCEKDLFVVYQMPSGAIPANNKNSMSCNTCGGSKSILDPHLAVVQVRGIAVDNTADLKFTGNTSNEGYGMRLKASFECDLLGWLCKATSTTTRLTLGGDAFLASDAIARAIMHQSRVLLGQTLIRTDRINKFTMLGTTMELVSQSIDYDYERYQEYLKLIASTYPTETTDCLISRSSNRIIKR